MIKDILIAVTTASLIASSLFLVDYSKKLEEQKLLNQLKTTQLRNYETTLERKNKDIEDLKGLISSAQRDLKLMYTLEKAGIRASSIEEEKSLLEQAKNLPFGSPFKDDFIITSRFGLRDESYFNGDGFHEGIDLISTTGRADADIFLVADATITDFGVSRIYGKYIIAETITGYQLVFKHLSMILYQNELGEVSNIPLKAGTRIAKMGNTGSVCFGAHLHYEIKIFDQESKTYKFLDPEEIIKYKGE